MSSAKLTYGYVENKYAKISAYFNSYRFNEDRVLGPVKCFSGEQLSLWLHEKLKSQGFNVGPPAADTMGWKFNCQVHLSELIILCENIRFNDEVLWKVSISSVDETYSFDETLPLSKTIKLILCGDAAISGIDWNREILNCNDDNIEPAKPSIQLVT